MGEYARLLSTGEEVKIGTTEDLMYLRADQVVQLQPADAARVIASTDAYLFRFPFPHEDGKTAGDFEDHTFGMSVPGLAVSQDVAHRDTQFVSSNGFNVMLPCPLSEKGIATGYRFHKNGFGGEVRIVRQRVWEGHLALVAECGGCRTWWRYPGLSDAEELIMKLRSAADRELMGNQPDEFRSKSWTALADRVTAGYTTPLPWA